MLKKRWLSPSKPERAFIDKLKLRKPCYVSKFADTLLLF